MKIASFDIGKKNFSFYVEELPTQFFLDDYIPSYNPDGTPTSRCEEYIRSIWSSGSCVLIDNVDLTYGCDSKMKLDPETFHNMNDLLSSYSDIWDTCDLFIIEKQMMFGKQTNPMAVKLGQHCYSYFCLKYGRDKQILEFPAYHKTQVLGAEKIKTVTKSGKVSYKAIDKPARKKWAVSTALEILSDRQDISTSNIISRSKKKDDLSDVICQLQAWKVLNLAYL